MNRDKPGLSSLQHLDRTVWGRQSSARDSGAGREHSGENLWMKRQTDII